MKRSLYVFWIYLLTVLFFLNTVCMAGQVVTTETKQWAKEVLSGEKALSTVTDPNSIGVLYFPNMTGNPELDPVEKGLAIMLTTDLAKLERFNVVERIKLQALMDEMELGASGLMDTKTTPRVGRLLGARFLSSGNLWAGKAAELMIEPRLTDVYEELMIMQNLAEGDVAELIAMEKEILFDTIEMMEVELTPEEKAELEKPLSASAAALMLLFQGVSESDGGNYNTAKALYEQALVEDPNLEIARNSIEEIEQLNLLSESDTAAETEEDAKSEKAEGEAAEPDAPATEVAAEKSSSGLGWLAAGIAVVGIAAGAVALGSSSSSSDDSEPTPQPPTEPTEPTEPEVDNTPPTVLSTSPTEGSVVDCQLSRVDFNFSEPMDPGIGTVSFSSENGWSDWSVPSGATTNWEINL